MANKSNLQIFALAVIELMILLPISHALGMTHAPNPAADVNETYAKIEWRTDKAATSQVDYGITRALSPGTVDPAFVTDHSVQLRGLTPNTRYYFQIVSVAQDGDYRIDSNYNQYYSFVTERFQDYAPPQISNVTLIGLTQTAAIISWTTNEEATTDIFYGVDSPSQHSSVPGYALSHIASIPTVEGSKYYYAVSSCDRAGNCINTSSFSFIAGADISFPIIIANIPRYDSNGIIDVIGTTEAYSQVSVYVNGVKKRVAPRDSVGASGEFRFTNVYLTQAENTVTIEAIDQVGNREEESYPVTVDSVPPTLIITSLPKVTVSPSIIVQGSVSELSTITFEAVSGKDTTPPSKVQSLNATLTGAAGAGKAMLSWHSVSAIDLDEYAIYRNDIRIAVTNKTNYTDTELNENTNYTYRISAVDRGCNEGAKSDSVSVTSPLGAGTALPITKDAELSCSKRIDKINVSGSFTHTLNLAYEGDNTITITAYDRAGNKAIFTNHTLKDSAAPTIVSHNLVGLQTVYSRTVVLKGKVSENATVLVYLDNSSSPSESVLTDLDGTFEKEVLIHLVADPTIQVANLSAAAGMGAGTGWKHHVKLVARDIAGIESPAVEGDIIFTFCGEGNWFTVTSAIGGPLAAGVTPDVLVPSLLRNGQAELAFTINLSYGGIGQASVRGISVRWAPQPAGQAGTDDRDWFQNPKVRCNAQKTQCLVLIQSNPVDLTDGTNMSSFAQDDAISNHRQGECMYGVGGTAGDIYGCVKLPVIIEIDFQETVATQVSYGATPQTLSGGVTESRVQKNCFDINMMIDRRIPSDKVPEHFLEEMIRWSDNAIELIDNVLEPLETVKKVVFYSCLTSWAALYLLNIAKIYNCDVSRFVESIEGGGFSKPVAEIGECDAVYPKDDNEDANENCNSCATAISNYMKLKRIQRGLCDRIFCSSAPTLRKYITDMKSETLTKVEGTTWKSGPSCKLVGGENNKEFGLTDIEKVYSSYLEVEKAAEGAENDNECMKPHPADIKCCGQEYLDEYGTVCGLGQELFYNELKESVCFEKEANNKPGKTLAGGGTINCYILGEVGEAIGGVLDTFSSILRCEPGAQPVPTLVNTPFLYKEGTYLTSDDHKVYYRIKQAKRDADKAQVWRGYTTKEKGLSLDDNDASIHSTETFIGEVDVTGFFGEKGKESSAGLSNFKNDLSGVATNYDKVKAEKTYEEIRSKLGYQLKDILVDPTSGFLRTIQCLCLSGITGYLKHYKAMLNLIRNCFAQILVTGSGSEGVCEAVLSEIVCDLIYDVISCVTKLVPAISTLGGERGGAFSDLASFVSAIGTAGSEVSSDISGRYGSSGMYQAMFNERKLINAICMWAFTGTWDIDFETMLEADVGVAINSTGFLYPCDRRFITPNPVSTPAGLATWNYHFGIGFVAGSDLTYSLKLKCSNDYSCSTSSGFSGGRCDCVGKEAQFHTVSGNIPGLGTGTLSKGETLGTGGTGNVYYQVESPLRYDTAVLEWSYTGNDGRAVKGSTSCGISQVGSGAPGYCQFDLGAGAFRCGIGITDEFWARFVSKPAPNYKFNATGFTLNDPLSFNVDIQQKLPASRGSCAGECEWTKYLTYTIKTHTGRVIANNTQEITDPNLVLNTDGEHILSVPRAGATVERHHFAPQAGAGAFSFSVLTGDPGLGPVTTPLLALKDISTDQYWIIDLKAKANNLIDYKIYSAVKGTGVDNYTRAIQMSSGTLAQNQNDISVPNIVNQPVATLSFAVGGKPGHDTTALLIYHAPSTSDTCVSYMTTPATWYATFTIWDSKKIAGDIYERGEVKAVDLNGAIQEYENIPFNVYCSTTAPAPVMAVLPCSSDVNKPITQRCECPALAGSTVICEAGEACDAGGNYRITPQPIPDMYFNTAGPNCLRSPVCPYGKLNLSNLGKRYECLCISADKKSGEICLPSAENCTNAGKCEWSQPKPFAQPAGAFDAARDCPNINACSGYNSFGDAICTADPCGIGELGRLQCAWKNNACALERVI